MSAFSDWLQVKQLVDEEQFARYDRLLLQSSLDLMADVVYCPRQSCGSAVILEPDATMGICPACQYAFCTLCKLGYHGLSHCKVTSGRLMAPRPLALPVTSGRGCANTATRTAWSAQVGCWYHGPLALQGHLS